MLFLKILTFFGTLFFGLAGYSISVFEHSYHSVDSEHLKKSLYNPAPSGSIPFIVPGSGLIDLYFNFMGIAEKEYQTREVTDQTEKEKEENERFFNKELEERLSYEILHNSTEYEDIPSFYDSIDDLDLENNEGAKHLRAYDELLLSFGDFMDVDGDYSTGCRYPDDEPCDSDKEDSQAEGCGNSSQCDTEGTTTQSQEESNNEIIEVTVEQCVIAHFTPRNLIKYVDGSLKISSAKKIDITPQPALDYPERTFLFTTNIKKLKKKTVRKIEEIAFQRLYINREQVVESEHKTTTTLFQTRINGATTFGQKMYTFTSPGFKASFDKKSTTLIKKGTILKDYKESQRPEHFELVKLAFEKVKSGSTYNDFIEKIKSFIMQENIEASFQEFLIGDHPYPILEISILGPFDYQVPQIRADSASIHTDQESGGWVLSQGFSSIDRDTTTEIIPFVTHEKELVAKQVIRNSYHHPMNTLHSQVDKASEVVEDELSYVKKRHNKLLTTLREKQHVIRVREDHIVLVTPPPFHLPYFKAGDVEAPRRDLIGVFISVSEELIAKAEKAELDQELKTHIWADFLLKPAHAKDETTPPPSAATNKDPDSAQVD